MPPGVSTHSTTRSSTSPTMHPPAPPPHPPTPPINLSLPPISLSPDLDLDSASSTLLPPIHEKPASRSGQTLPSLSSLTAAIPPSTTPSSSTSTPSSVSGTIAPTSAPSSVATNSPVPTAQHWPSLNPFTAYYAPSHVQNPEPPMRKDYVHSNGHQRATSVSLDDPGVRAAAEALGRLRTVDTTPHDRDARRHLTPDSFHASSPDDQQHQKQQEPLLSLITTSYPSIAPFAPYIESATSACNTAYNQSKNYSPVIKRNAEYLEDRVVKPVAKTVGNLSGPGLRWWLQKPSKKQRQHDVDGDRQGVKRRKADQGDFESALAARVLADAAKERRASVSTIDTLPAYDEHRSPAYTEIADDLMSSRNGAMPAGTKLWVVTSGLGVAMKDESKKKMRCLIHVLNTRNSQVSEFLGSLTKAVEEYDGTAPSGDNQDTAMTGQEEQHRSELTNRIQWLIGSIYGTTKTVVDVVDKQAASVLPTNVKRVVEGCLMSLPAQFKLMAQQEPPAREAQNSNDEGTAVRNSAHRALLLAKASLRMMTQITDVLNMTLTSAEEWCQKQENQESEKDASSSSMKDYEPAPYNGDVKMSG
ncbi:transcription factor Opi1-domain-containing protein [Podospora fimiseda]|uniref:Transcription factor Opi1-domain-containing protein n=1 Tax=Podospora fimiseda TaxID=252190 RepID=A0AAN7GW30_9PEZI|nr:transcription factor Opi1-domain-containing protein [Podospora fimiseda]